MGTQCLDHGQTSLLKTGDHGPVLGHAVFVFVCLRDLHGMLTGFKPMALGGVARLESQDADIHDAIAMQSNQPMRGTHKTDGALTGHVTLLVQLVLHDLGDRQFGQCSL